MSARRPAARPQEPAREATQDVLDRLRWRIQLSPLTQRALERRLGFSKGYLSQVLRGHVDLKLNHLFSLLEALEVGPREFFAKVPDDPVNPPRNAEEEMAFAARGDRPSLARLYSFGLQSIDDFERRLERCEEALGAARSRGLL